MCRTSDTGATTFYSVGGARKKSKSLEVAVPARNHELPARRRSPREYPRDCVTIARARARERSAAQPVRNNVGGLGPEIDFIGNHCVLPLGTCSPVCADFFERRFDLRDATRESSRTRFFHRSFGFHARVTEIILAFVSIEGSERNLRKLYCGNTEVTCKYEIMYEMKLNGWSFQFITLQPISSGC